MKKAYGLVGVGFIVLCVLVMQGCVARETHPGQGFRHGQLRVTDLTMFPDPVLREGQRLFFTMVMVNESSYSRKINIAIRDGDQLVSEASDILVRPGTNRIQFPYSGYRFSRENHCFVVLVDIEGNYMPVDIARKFCARRTNLGWTLRD